MILSWSNLDSLVSHLRDYPAVFVLYDGNVTELVSGLPYPKMALKADERSKTLETAGRICSWLLSGNADRNALLVNIGGGITTDLGGFAASIYKRGVKYANIPTTLLSQVDAAIGGKTGVNHDGMKNMIGSFLRPEFTILCPKLLKSLPERQMLEGIAELLKTAMISEDWTMYDRAVELFSSHMPKDLLKSENLLKELSELVLEAASLKESITERDYEDNGERRKLNLGHTFAHAIEARALSEGESISHGEAVGMGIVMACDIAAKKNICELEFADMIRMDFEDCGLKTACPYGSRELLEYMKNDKKAEGGKMKFVLPADLGDIRIMDFTPEEIFEKK